MNTAVARGDDVLLLRVLAERAGAPVTSTEAHEALIAELVARAGGRAEPLLRARSLVEGCIHSMRGDPATAARALRLLVDAVDETSGRPGPGCTDEVLPTEQAS